MATRKITELPEVASASESDYLFGMVNGSASRIPAKAARGDDGQDGADGATFTPTVSEDGTLSWTNDKNLTNPDPVNLRGADGRDGADGADGADGRDAPQIDDEVVSISSPWSSARIVECFPSFEVSGTEVSFEAVTGSPLEVTTLLTFAQGGSGDASSANVRPITAYDSLTIRHGDQEIVQPFNHPVCSGMYAWDTGLLTEDMTLLEIGANDGAMIRLDDTTEGLPQGYRFAITLDRPANTSKRTEAASNMMRCVSNLNANYDYECFGISSTGLTLYFVPHKDAGNTVESLCAWLAEHPVQIAYIPAEPKTTQYDAQIITAGTGVNVMSAVDGTLTVKGRMNPSAAIAALQMHCRMLELRVGEHEGRIIELENGG